MSVQCSALYTPLLYSKTGIYRGIHYFLFLLQNIDCGYSLEPPHCGCSNGTHHQCFEQLKINIFTAVKYCCILQGRVFIMANANVTPSLIGQLQELA